MSSLLTPMAVLPISLDQQCGCQMGVDTKTPVSWQTAMKRAIRSVKELRARLGLPPDAAAEAAESFPTFVPLELLRRIEQGNPYDPILRQVLASPLETHRQPGYRSDPVGDLQADVGAGLLHKYPGRALLVTHGACAVHCRYCFRREFPYSNIATSRQRWKPALKLIRKDDSISEVLLSGGDPLTLSDAVIDELITAIEEIGHVRRLRIHTRLPIVIPQRVTERLIDRLSNSRLSVWMVVHSNHAQEIDQRVAESLVRIRQAGLPVLNQSVLLSGVNDDIPTLEQLSLRLIDLGVQPYYLHQLDRVLGAGHFWVEPDRGRQLMAGLRERLPGYAVPQYVVEIAGKKSKTPIA